MRRRGLIFIIVIIAIGINPVGCSYFNAIKKVNEKQKIIDEYKQLSDEQMAIIDSLDKELKKCQQTPGSKD